MKKKICVGLVAAMVFVTMTGTAFSSLAATVNGEHPQYADDYDPEVPLKNYIDAFGLRLMPVTEKMIEYGAEPWEVTSKENDYERMIEGLPIDDTTWAGLNAGSGAIMNEWAVLTGQMEYYISGHDNLYGTEQHGKEITAVLKQFINSFDWRNATEQERAVAAAKWLCQAEYDYEAVENKKEVFGISAAWGYYGSLVEKKAVCNGLVSGYDMLCRAVGLKATAWSGRSMDHVSNQIYLDGKWYHFDPTNYAGYPHLIQFDSSFHLLGGCYDCWADMDGQLNIDS